MRTGIKFMIAIFAFISILSFTLNQEKRSSSLKQIRYKGPVKSIEAFHFYPGYPDKIKNMNKLNRGHSKWYYDSLGNNIYSEYYKDSTCENITDRQYITYNQNNEVIKDSTAFKQPGLNLRTTYSYNDNFSNLITNFYKDDRPQRFGQEIYDNNLLAFRKNAHYYFNGKEIRDSTKSFLTYSDTTISTKTISYFKQYNEMNIDTSYSVLVYQDYDEHDNWTIAYEYFSRSDKYDYDISQLYKIQKRIIEYY